MKGIVSGRMQREHLRSSGSSWRSSFSSAPDSRSGGTRSRARPFHSESGTRASLAGMSSTTLDRTCRTSEQPICVSGKLSEANTCPSSTWPT